MPKKSLSGGFRMPSLRKSINLTLKPHEMSIFSSSSFKNSWISANGNKYLSQEVLVRRLLNGQQERRRPSAITNKKAYFRLPSLKKKNVQVVVPALDLTCFRHIWSLGKEAETSREILSRSLHQHDRLLKMKRWNIIHRIIFHIFVLVCTSSAPHVDTTFTPDAFLTW